MVRSIAIKSFYVDYYDHTFESQYYADVIWERVSDRPPFKIESFRLLEEAGYKVPVHGTKETLLRAGLHPKTKVVAYYDPKGHCTEGKYLTTLDDVWYDNMYCSQYIITQRPEHTRVAYIGNKEAAYKMWSNDEWRSNTGTEIEMESCKVPQEMERSLLYPIHAIDFVDGYAVDLNFSPGLGKTPIQDAIPSSEVYGLFQDWVAEKGVDSIPHFFTKKGLKNAK